MKYYDMINDLLKAYEDSGNVGPMMGKVQHALRSAEDKDKLAQQLYEIAMSHGPDSETRAFALETLAASRAGYNDHVLDAAGFFLLSRDNILMFQGIACASDLPWEYRCKIYSRLVGIPLNGMAESVQRAGFIFMQQFKDMQADGSGI